MNVENLLAEVGPFREKLKKLKSDHSLGSRRWYPYDTLANLQHLSRMLKDSQIELNSISSIADIGAADGDLAFYLEAKGFKVHIYDSAPTNMNALRGAHQIRILMDSSVRIFDVDLDGNFAAVAQYDLIFFLGILYHLKNPFGVMEALAKSSKYLFLSTKTAKTFAEGQFVDGSPAAYLLGPHEANNDKTNYWVFTRAGLERLIDRTGFEVLAYSVGDAPDSHPSKKDERTFALLKSRHFK